MTSYDLNMNPQSTRKREMNPASDQPLLTAEGVKKAFNGVPALRNRLGAGCQAASFKNHHGLSNHCCRSPGLGARLWSRQGGSPARITAGQ